jgi:hypothetical protein
MPKMDRDESADKPLDPAIESIRRRMLRTLVLSIGIMCVGLMAVLGAIVYKVATPSGPGTAAAAGEGVPSGAPVEARAALPQGFSVSNVGLDGNRILFYGTTADGAARALVFDVEAGRVVADVAVTH